MKIYVVLSNEWNECSLWNRAFKDDDEGYENALIHLIKAEQATGSDFRVIHIELEE